MKLSETRKTEFKIGDLVKLAPWCMNSDICGIVTRKLKFGPTIYVTFPNRRRGEERVLKDNLILIARG